MWGRFEPASPALFRLPPTPQLWVPLAPPLRCSMGSPRNLPATSAPKCEVGDVEDLGATMLACVGVVLMGQARRGPCCVHRVFRSRSFLLQVVDSRQTLVWHCWLAMATPQAQACTLAVGIPSMLFCFKCLLSVIVATIFRCAEHFSWFQPLFWSCH